MGKLNYTKRKIEGLKLGQVVHKDLCKRIPPEAGSKAAYRDPILDVNLAGKTLGDVGAREVFDALTRALRWSDEGHRVALLEELTLSGNSLTARSLWGLADIMPLAAYDIMDLDLSGNAIAISTDEEALAWQTFLESMSDCTTLRRLDLSDNQLGPRAFEVLCRVYAKEKPVDVSKIGPSRLTDLHQSGTVEQDQRVSRPARKTSLNGNARIISGSGPGNRRNTSKARGRRGSSLAAEPSIGIVSRQSQVNSATAGLRSIPYIVFSNTGMTDTCALHLSYVLEYHNYPALLGEFVPPVKPGSQAQQLETYARSGCQGIIYRPNAELSQVGQRLLELAEIPRAALAGPMTDENPNACESLDVSIAHLNTGGPRRVSEDAPQSVSEFNRSSSRRESLGSAFSHGTMLISAGNGSHSGGSELDRARIKVQGQTIREAGATSVELWRAALKLMCVSRAVLLEQNTRATSETLNCIGIKTLHAGISTLTTQAVDDELRVPPRTPVARCRRSIESLTTISPMTLRSQVGSSTSISSVQTSPLSWEATQREEQGADVKKQQQQQQQQLLSYDLPCRLPWTLWQRILVAATDADGILNHNQQLALMHWARKRKTLDRVQETRGKSDSAQIWRILEATGCLTYDMDGRCGD
ncbi:MAG: hypothetical protein M1825_006058 [Sarcosagium campestre]|nr:MAG: hypothetical protein M1825_006058 [Sarcosagium campestre]